MTFDGQVAIVTGSSQGIGLACARRLARDSAAVVLNGRSPDALAGAAARLRRAGAEVTTVAADLADPDTPARLVAAAVDTFGRVDLLVASLGLAPHIGPTLEIGHADFSRTMVANTWLGLGLLRSAIDAGLASGGAMVNLTAIGTRKLFVPAGVYSAAKAAVELLTRTLALEVAGRGIRVNAVAPGLIRTPATEFLLADAEQEKRQAAAVPLGRIGEAEDIANAVAFLLSAEAGFVTGVVLDVDGGSLLSSVGFEH